MSAVLEDNQRYAERLKTVLKLRNEPVACKLIKEGEEFPAGVARPEAQLTHCQAVFRAKSGECFALTAEDEGCHVGAAVLGMMPTPDKVASGEFHGGMGMFDSVEAAKEMIDARLMVDYKTIGEVVCPLKKADFVPDVVILVDIPERIYWVVPLEVAAKGGRVQFSTAPYQCCCEDIDAVPLITDRPNISLGCFGCRKKTDMAADEMAIGIPYKYVEAWMPALDVYKDGVLTKAKRD